MAVMEPDEEMIARNSRLTGTTEQEARTLYHLDRAWYLLAELPGLSARDLYTIGLCMEALTNIIRRRVLERDYPEGWGVAEDEGQDAGQR